MVQPSTGDGAGQSREASSKKAIARIGIVLILLSGLLWFSLFAIPFLPLTVVQKAALAGGVFAGVQVAWWSGAAMAGPQLVARLKSWRKNGRQASDATDDSSDE
ncbi:MAG: transporter suffix domain-containing protein [Rhodopirellula sp.]|nr:transporter suffix domain-containing protein [Rhodopirellula sp.]